MKRFALKFFIIIITTYIFSKLFDSIQIGSSLALLAFGVTMLVVSVTIKPIFLLISLPISLLTFGIFSLVVNTWMVMLSSAFIPGISIHGFWISFLLSSSFSLLNSNFVYNRNE